MAGRRDGAQYASDATALVLTGAVAALLLVSNHALLNQRLLRSERSDRGIELTVQLAQPQTPPAPPPPTPPRVRTHRAVLQPAPTPPDPLSVQSDPAPVDAAVVAASVALPAPAAITHPDLEAQYASQLRADIERRKHPPDSAQYRLHHPSGEVRVRFFVLRNGEPRAVTVLSSSGSSLLDAEALQLVSSGHYPAMPAQVFVGETQHPFTVTIEFPPALLTNRSP